MFQLSDKGQVFLSAGEVWVESIKSDQDSSIPQANLPLSQSKVDVRQKWVQVTAEINSNLCSSKVTETKKIILKNKQVFSLKFFVIWTSIRRNFLSGCARNPREGSMLGIFKLTLPLIKLTPRQISKVKRFLSQFSKMLWKNEILINFLGQTKCFLVAFSKKIYFSFDQI